MRLYILTTMSVLEECQINKVKIRLVLPSACLVVLEEYQINKVKIG